MTAMNRAGIGRRLAALLIDIVLIIPFSLALVQPILKVESWFGFRRFLSIDTGAEAWMAIILILFGATWGYLLIEVIASATPGKLILGLTVRCADGLPAGIGRRLTRYFLKASCLLIILPFGVVETVFPTTFFLCFGLTSLAGLFLVFGKNRQTLYEILTRTAVCRRQALV